MDGILRFTGAVERDPAIDVWLITQAPELGAIATPFAYVNVFRAHVNVGFFFGAELEDTAGLLEGSGKRMRHVKLKPGADLHLVALSALIGAAYADIKLRLAAEP